MVLNTRNIIMMETRIMVTMATGVILTMVNMTETTTTMMRIINIGQETLGVIIILLTLTLMIFVTTVVLMEQTMTCA
jgi:hypothetical protein